MLYISKEKYSSISRFFINLAKSERPELKYVGVILRAALLYSRAL